MTYERGDVRDPAALERALQGADVVVHLAFQIAGTGSPDEIRRINLDGTRNVVEAAVAAGVKRLVYASSVAAYGFHADNPVGIREDWPVRPARTLFYAQQKAELDAELQQLQQEHPDLDVYVLRPSIVVGPNTMGGKLELPALLQPLARSAAAVARGAGALHVPVLAPRHPLQLVHEDDVGAALSLCTVGAGPAGAYNIAGDGTVTVEDVLRELGYSTVPVPGAVSQWMSRLASGLARPGLVPPAVTWVEAGSHPAIMDTSKAKQELGWRPRYDARAALRVAVAAHRRSA
jgi:nucleoside-diphosphate-sugar epimerase